MDVPAARNIDLLYVSKYDDVDVFSYPAGKRVGTLTGFQSPGGLCVDKAGDVFVTNFGASNIVEYAHGGTKPIATLSDPYQEPDDCSVDPTTGNLAVANIGGSVSIYEGARGHPKQRTDSEIAYMFSEATMNKARYSSMERTTTSISSNSQSYPPAVRGLQRSHSTKPSGFRGESNGMVTISPWAIRTRL